MAYDASNEKQVEVGCIDKNTYGDKIMVKRIIPKDKARLESVDVRNMYTSKDGNVYPAKQGGLRMNSELVVEVMTLVYKAMSEEERSDFQNSIEG